MKVFLSPVTECSLRRPSAPHSNVNRNLGMAAPGPTAAASHLTVRLLGVALSRLREVGGSAIVVKVRDFSSEIVLKKIYTYSGVICENMSCFVDSLPT